MEMSIKKAEPTDLKEMQQLFVGSITSVCKTDYNPEQIKIWASSIEDKERWSRILSDQVVLLAMSQNKIIGFVTLNTGNYIDMFFVHRNYQRQGIAGQLYRAIETQVRRVKGAEIVSDVSITARPFFERMGFEVVQSQTVKRKQMEFTNFKMIKKLK